MEVALQNANYEKSFEMCSMFIQHGDYVYDETCKQRSSKGHKSSLNMFEMPIY
jgi:hypothetical protein